MKNIVQKHLILIAIALSISSCSKDEVSSTLSSESSVPESSFDEKKSKNPTHKTTNPKDDFIALSFADRRDLWLDKLDQILGTSINSAQEVEIETIIDVYTNASDWEDVITDPDLEDAAYEMLHLTSDEDFLLMFNTLDDYEVINAISRRSDISSSEIVGNLDIDFTPDTSSTTGSLAGCNCKWTCGINWVGCTTNQCEKTNSGCGFLWLFSCTGRNQSSNCPGAQ